jgi:signal transduction histidine kinase
VKTKSNAIRLNVEADRKETALKQLDQLSSASKEAMLEIRASILGLRAITQDREAIQVTLATFLQKFQDLTEIEIESDLPQPGAEIHLSPESELHVLRITQEALTNIHKHSGVKQAHVSLRRVNGHIELSIRDRGDGFTAQGTPSNNPFSFGLNNMRERAVAMRATFDIHTRPHEGTEILVVIPLEAK